MAKKTKKSSPGPQKTIAKPVRAAPTKDGMNINFEWIALGVTIFCCALIRFRLLNIPLERDEGEYAYIGNLMLNGKAPYTEAYSMKLPGTSAMYSLFMELFGKNSFGIHMGLLLLNMATIIFLFLAFKKLFNSSVALIAASVYAIMSISPTVLGFAAHATHFVNFFMAVALYFLAGYYDKRKILYAFLVGIMFGLSFVMKQQAIFFILFGGIAIVLVGALEKPIVIKSIILPASVYSAGVVIPYGITVLMLKMAGAFDKFWFWTVSYAGKYAGGLTFSEGMKEFATRFKPMWEEFAVFWLLFFAGMILVFLTKFSLKQKLTIVLFSFAAFLTICPGFYFRRHYFITFLPAVGLLCAISLYYLGSLFTSLSKTRLISILPFALFGLVAIVAITRNKDFYLQSSPDEISRKQYGNNPFIESVTIADYLKQNTTDTDRIAVLGSEPQIFFYADRLSATGYIYTYPLVEIQEYNQKMQEEMIAEIEKIKPKYFIYIAISASWLPKQDCPKTIFDWINQYSNQNYDLTGIADITGGQTIYKWNDDARTYKPTSQQHILIYKRKEGI